MERFRVTRADEKKQYGATTRGQGAEAREHQALLEPPRNITNSIIKQSFDFNQDDNTGPGKQHNPLALKR